MSFTMTRSATDSWTLTNAKYLASKVTADMLRCQQTYGQPGNDQINDYGTELALLLRDGYVHSYEFGYKLGENRVISWKYTVDATGLSTTDDRPGKLVTDVDIAGAVLFNFLTYSTKWSNQSQEERSRVNSGLPFIRSSGNPPGDGLGYWQRDLSYYSSGVSLGRTTFRRY